jgi:hypothetical protein
VVQMRAHSAVLYHAIQAVKDDCIGCVVHLLRRHGEDLRRLTISGKYGLRDFAVYYCKPQIDAALKKRGLQYVYYARRPKCLAVGYLDSVTFYSSQ